MIKAAKFLLTSKQKEAENGDRSKNQAVDAEHSQKKRADSVSDGMISECCRSLFSLNGSKGFVQCGRHPQQ